MAANSNRRSAGDELELDLLLEAIYRRFGYDFRSYARASIERRARLVLSTSGCASYSEMIPKLFHDDKFFPRLVSQFSVAVTEMFRDPQVYRSIREKVVPLLRTWPHFKVWHAGCASGEEVYSLAIVLKEEGIYDRATIYATDFNDSVLGQARDGIYATGKLQEATRNYQQAGGRRSFSEYYHAGSEAAAMDADLRARVLFSGHNLATDGVFGEMQLICCRNVLIYFNRELQDRALTLFTESLVNGGFLCLGTKENLRFSVVSNCYDVVDDKARIYKKRARQ